MNNSSDGLDGSLPLPSSTSRRKFLYSLGRLTLVSLAAQSESHAAPAPPGDLLELKNETLRLTLDPATAAISVHDQRDGYRWTQTAAPGFYLDPATVQRSANQLSAEVAGPSLKATLTVALRTDTPHGFTLKLAVHGPAYSERVPYPFPFTASGPEWQYVQNTTGEGILMPLAQLEKIEDAFGWAGGQPWWGLTDLHRGMSARLETFRLPGPGEETVYARPLHIEYAFFTEGGYTALVKDFRRVFLAANPGLQPLRNRVANRPAIGHLQDSIYAYFWGADSAEDLAVAQEMKAAGIDRAIALFYGRHETDRATCDGIKELGWVVGQYRMPAGNLFQVSKKHHWSSALLTGRISASELLAKSEHRAWDRICGQTVLKEWPGKAKETIDAYGFQLFYFDTFVAQLAPCLAPEHPTTIEENLAARRELLRQTQEMGLVVGSGEGLCPTWAMAHLDFFEGAMSLRTYSDNPLKIPSGDFATDMGESYAENASVQLDETRRVPLFQLAFHDYVAGTWVWRDTNFQSSPFAWKKNLFNLLYGSMPMWHINRALWKKFGTEMLASYRQITPIRQRIGFAEMLNYGWLTPDRSVQYTDWSTGDRVIVNFGEVAFTRTDGEPVAPRSGVLVKKA